MREEPGQVYRKIKNPDYLEVLDGYVIYDESAERAILLNPTAVAVLELCEGGTDAAAIAALMRQAFALTADPLTDVEICLRMLLAEGLVEAESPAPGTAVRRFLTKILKRRNHGLS